MSLLANNVSTAEALVKTHFCAFDRDADGLLRESELGTCLERLCTNAGLQHTHASRVLKDLCSSRVAPFAVNCEELRAAFLRSLSQPALVTCQVTQVESTSTLAPGSEPPSEPATCRELDFEKLLRNPSADSLDAKSAARWHRAASLLLLNPTTRKVTAKSCFERVCNGLGNEAQLPAQDFQQCLMSLCENVGLPDDSPAGEWVLEAAADVLKGDQRNPEDTVTQEEFCTAFFQVLRRVASGQKGVDSGANTEDQVRAPNSTEPFNLQENSAGKDFLSHGNESKASAEMQPFSDSIA